MSFKFGSKKVKGRGSYWDSTLTIAHITVPVLGNHIYSGLRSAYTINAISDSKTSWMKKKKCKFNVATYLCECACVF